MAIPNPLTDAEKALLNQTEPSLSRNPPGIDLADVLDRFRDTIQSEIDGSAGALGDGILEVTVAPADTARSHGWHTVAAKLIKCEVMMVGEATVGAYTLAVIKDPGGSPAQMLDPTPADITSTGDLTVATIPLTGTEADRTLAAGEIWRVEFVSDNAGLDADAVYLTLTWEPV